MVAQTAGTDLVYSLYRLVAGSVVEVWFTLLGEVRAGVRGRALDLGHLRQRCVLAALLVDVNQVVETDRLIERVWGDAAPYKARTTLYGYLYRLRRALPESADVRIVREPGGYALRADPATIDTHRFAELTARARHADDAHALDLLTEALGLWHGEALAQLDTPWFAEVRADLHRRRSDAELAHADAALRLGRPGLVLADLARRADERPLDERVAAQYALALHLDGRRADALAHFQLVRARLADELGSDPGDALREAHQRILTDAPETQPLPRQLPAAPRHFSGREDEEAQLDTAPRTLITGAGGVGKTSLALHWAHRNAHRFPDGQLYADLRGFDPATEQAAPDAVLRGFLAALGVPQSATPADALYRSATTGKRLLVVLDDAASAAQVVPLLPGSPTCAVVVTSRNRLIELTTRHGVHPLPLDVLPDADARDLFARLVGPQRAAAEPHAARALLDACAGLPIAISIIAARAATRPNFPLAALADDLEDGLHAVFRGSYAELTDEQAALFRLLGIAPGPDVTAQSAARLADVPPARARRTLTALEDASLLRQHAPGRYRMHDLVRAFAREEADHDPAALARFTDFHVRTAIDADRMINPHRTPVDGPDCAPAPLTDPLAWFDAEHATLLAVQREAADPRRVWELAWALSGFHRKRGLQEEAHEVWTAGVAAAHDDPARLNVALRSLGDACARMGRHAEAVEHLSTALTTAHDLSAQAHTHQDLARAWELHGDDRTARDHATQALDLHRDLGDRVWESDLLNAVGWFSARLGEYDRARQSCTAALDLSREVGYREGEASTLDSLGYIAHHTGRSAEAATYYEQALAVFRDLGDAYQQANTLDRWAEACADPELWRQALALYRAQGREEDAERVRLAISATTFDDPPNPG